MNRVADLARQEIVQVREEDSVLSVHGRGGEKNFQIQQ